jgi:hypothetical protein
MSQEGDGKGCRKERRRGEKKRAHSAWEGEQSRDAGVMAKGGRQQRCLLSRGKMRDFSIIFHSPKEKKNKLS